MLIKTSGGDGFLYFTNGSCDLDLPWAGKRAVENCMASKNTKLVVEDLQPFCTCPVPAVKNESMSVDDGSWSHVFLISPERRTGGGTGGAQDTLGRVVKSFTLFRTLQAFGLGWGLIIYKVWHYRTEVFKEGFHINDQVFDHA